MAELENHQSSPQRRHWQAVNSLLLQNRSLESCPLPRQLVKDKAFRKDHVDTSHFLERNLKMSVNQNICLTSPKAGLVSKSSHILNPTEQGMPGDGLVPRKEFGRVLKTGSSVSTQSDRLCLCNYQWRKGSWYSDRQCQLSAQEQSRYWDLLGKE